MWRLWTYKKNYALCFYFHNLLGKKKKKNPSKCKNWDSARSYLSSLFKIILGKHDLIRIFMMRGCDIIIFQSWWWVFQLTGISISYHACMRSWDCSIWPLPQTHVCCVLCVECGVRTLRHLQIERHYFQHPPVGTRATRWESPIFWSNISY